MSLTRTFCDERVRAATLAADQSILDNVRQRELRSAAAWQAMSDRIQKLETTRSARERAQLEARQEQEASQADDGVKPAGN
ncbi:hypothetical protein [Novosphingobium pentaromativorans]|uniref:Uncharacterized protein n=1 Tax=Novosphingobium pentaromativorans US6-1 TaxID=1088721 RepID=G6EH76_9SPHN|nr:hypothetical protein [Novosphingobium pentaromativorans]AIT81952.1 hypothetical protein JI59_20540 [Novosphingobium pentaromativorans US6-1]EHJ59365.1 hypothetical protein NSU_3697 [Novosphingobium pentaromativorans US6-1]